METKERWKKAVIVPLHKSKGNKDECNNYRGISLLSVPGKVNGRILTERLMQVNEKKVSDEQGVLGEREVMWINSLQLKC